MQTQDALTSEGLLCAPVRYEMLPMQPGDVYRTEADTSAIERVLGFVPQTDLAHGLREFAKWYRSYHRP